MSAPVIGIDLGTTYSCVAVVQHDKVEIIANDQGNRITPSCVAFTEDELLVGEAAKNQQMRNPENTVFGVKRMIGRKFDDPELEEDLKNLPFKVVDANGDVKIEVRYKGETKQFLPEEISAMVLRNMKKTAEDYLGKTVTDAVITVPAYFNNSQRQATKDAGEIAGLNVIRIINEPTAAALAFGLNKKFAKKQKVLIFDLGGGTFDISVMSVVDNDFEVHFTAGDTHLGGEDFDNLLVDHIATEFKRQHTQDPRDSPEALLKLKTECEKAKRALSKCSKADIEIHPFYEGTNLSSKITKARFGELCAAKFQGTIDTVQKALDDNKMDKSSIDEVVLVGGSTRIPKIRKMLERFFDGKQLNLQVNADEAVAYGAAVQAAALSGEEVPGIEDLLLLDVVPMSLGTDVSDGSYKKIIERNSRIPISHEKKFKTEKDFQTRVHIGIYEGEEPLFLKNHLLGEFILDDLTSARAGNVKILVKFSIDADGILNVSAKEISTGHSKEIVIKCLNSKSQEDIQRSQAIVAKVDAEESEDDED